MKTKKEDIKVTAITKKYLVCLFGLLALTILIIVKPAVNSTITMVYYTASFLAVALMTVLVTCEAFTYKDYNRNGFYHYQILFNPHVRTILSSMHGVRPVRTIHPAIPDRYLRIENDHTILFTSNTQRNSLKQSFRSCLICSPCSHASLKLKLIARLPFTQKKITEIPGVFYFIKT